MNRDHSLMETNTYIILSPHSRGEVISKISSITTPNYSQAYKEPGAAYYGEVSHQSFDIKNVRYSPGSSAPNIKGTVEEHSGKTRINIDLDIRSHYHLVRTMYFSTLIPIGFIVMALCFPVLKGTDFLPHGLAFSAVFVLSPFLFTRIMKSTLISVKKKEIKNFLRQVNGEIISSEKG